MLITLRNLQRKISLIINNKVWPFTVISDLTSKLDQAEHERHIAVVNLENYMRRDIRSADFHFYDSFNERPVQIQVTTGYETIQSTYSNNYVNGTERAEGRVVVLQPYVTNYAWGIPFPNYKTQPEVATRYRELLADFTADIIRNRMLEETYNDSY